MPLSLKVYMNKENSMSKKKRVLIDKQGRIFGKYDVFYFLLGLIILALVVLGLRVAFEKEIFVDVELFASGGEWWWNIGDPPYWLVDPVQKGSIEYDPQGRKLVEVLDTQKFESGERKMLWIKARLLVTGSKKSNKYRFRQEPLEIGKVIFIAPDNIRINSNVMWIEGLQSYRQDSERTITIKIEERLQWFVDSINVGDVMKEDDGDILAEVISKEVVPSEVITRDDKGELHVKEHPTRSDIFLTIKMRTIYSRGRDYFSYFQPLKIDFWIWIPLEHLNVNGTIIEIE